MKNKVSVAESDIYVPYVQMIMQNPNIIDRSCYFPSTYNKIGSLLVIHKMRQMHGSINNIR